MTALIAKLVVMHLVIITWCSNVAFLVFMKLASPLGRTFDSLIVLLTCLVSNSTPPAAVLLSLAPIHGVSSREM